MEAWEEKAHRVIAEDCRAQWLKANTKPGGGFYREHRPYRTTALTDQLVTALGLTDREEAEHTIKCAFIKLNDGAKAAEF